MTDVQQTESDVIDKLVARAKLEGELSPRAIVVNRTQAKNSVTRTVRFALVVGINNEALIDALIDECILNKNNFVFIGSEAQLQSDMEIDYLFFEANIFVKRN